jgi:hypothetical protein
MTYERHGLANRLERRKHRTRAALIKAAEGFIAVGKVNVPVLEITQAADVGARSITTSTARNSCSKLRSTKSSIDSARCSTACHPRMTPPNCSLAASG